MSQWEPKRGDVVTLKSNPEWKSTVVGYNMEKKQYELVWLSKDGVPIVMSIDVCALDKPPEPPPPFDPDNHPAVKDKLAALSSLIEEVRSAGNDATALRAEVAEHKARSSSIVSIAQAMLPDLDRNIEPATAVRSMLDLALTWKNEGNAMIERLRAEIAALRNPT